MRNLRTRRYFGSVLTFLLVICAVLFIEGRIEAFMPQVKIFAESRMEDALGGKVNISIGRIDGGILHPVTFKNIKISAVGGKEKSPFLEISAIKTAYRAWDLLGAKGAKDAFEAEGYFSMPSGEKVGFEGSIKNGVYNIEVKPARGFIAIQGTISKDSAIEANFKVSHLAIGGQDLVCDGVLKSEVVLVPGIEVARPAIQGVIETRNCVLNYRPFLNLKTSYVIADGKIEISDFSLSDIFRGHGTFGLKAPFDMDAVITINNMSSTWLALALGAKDASSIISGTFNVKCELKGPANNIRSNVTIDAKKGTIGPMSFEYLSAHLKGDGPIMRIEDSRITRESGAFVIAGEMDLSKIGRGSMFEKLQLVGDEKAINWDGWNSTSSLGTSETTMTKQISDEIGIDFKKFTSEDAVDERLKSGDEVQLEYKLHPNDSLKVSLGQDKDFMGIEHKNKF